MSWDTLQGVIKDVTITDSSVKIVTDKGTWKFHAIGDCCANAFIHDSDTAQDEFEGLIGQNIVSAEEEYDGSEDYEGEYRDTTFYKLQCEKDSATITLYVDHNGYYGGSLTGGKARK